MSIWQAGEVRLARAAGWRTRTTAMRSVPGVEVDATCGTGIDRSVRPPSAARVGRPSFRGNNWRSADSQSSGRSYGPVTAYSGSCFPASGRTGDPPWPLFSRKPSSGGTARALNCTGNGNRIKDMDIEEVLIAPHSPWQNPYCERVIGSIRRDCLNRLIVLNGRHWYRILTDDFDYYHNSRPHLSLDRNSPIPREVEPPSQGEVFSIRQVGGLHHRYSRAA